MITITQIISNKCNCHCYYCLNGKALLEKELTVEELISFYSKIDKDELVTFKITGGEPFYPGTLAKTVELATYMLKNKNIEKLQINTNGYFTIPNRLFDNRVEFQISLDGNRQYQNKVCGVDIYDRIMKNLETLRNNGAKAHLMCVVTEENLQYIDDVYAVGQKFGFETLFQYVAPVGKAGSYNTNKAMERIAQINEKYPRKCRRFIDKCPNFMPDHGLQFAVDTKGNIINCPYLQDFKTGLTIFDVDTKKDKDMIMHTLETVLNGRTCCIKNEDNL